MALPTRRVLIVDDSEIDRDVCRRYLSADADWHYECSDAETGAEGMAQVRAGRFDCLLLDYRLPDMDALEFLTGLAPHGADLMPAAIVLTGQGSEAVAVSLMKAGAQDYLVKGTLTSESLRRSVRYAVEKGSLLRHLEQHTRELAAANVDLTQEMERRVAAERRLQAMAADLERLVDVRTAELVRANALKDEFMAAVSHVAAHPVECHRRVGARAQYRAAAPRAARQGARHHQAQCPDSGPVD